MKKTAALLLVLLLCASAAQAEMPEYVLGEWTDYGSITRTANDNVLTITRADQMYGADSFVIYEDGSIEFTTVDGKNSMGTWEWEDEHETILLIDSTGTQMRCLPMDSMLYTTLSYGESEEVMAYYRPSLYNLNAEYYEGFSWKLENFIVDCDQDAESEKSYKRLFEKVRAWDVQTDYCFTLNAGGDADIMINYIPLDGEWWTEGFNIIIENEWGQQLELEVQIDESLFGTMRYGNGETHRVHFATAETMIFADPVTSIEELNGSWEMTGLYNAQLFYHRDKDELSFTQTMAIDNGDVVLEYITSDGQVSTMHGTAEIHGGAILKDDESGDVMTFIRDDGMCYAFAILNDGRLYWKNPNNMCYYFEKVA